MMYANHIVACVKVAGQILREQGDTVTLPFGSEYSLLIKNLHLVRAQVKVSIDGTDVTSGTWLVIKPNDSLELERFISNGNWNSGNRFKFIERTEQIDQHRGVGAEDGLIRIEWAKELVIPKPIHVPVIHDHYDEPWYPRPCPPPYPYPWRRPGIPRRSLSMRPQAKASSGRPQRSRGPSGQSRSVNMNHVAAEASVTMAFSDAGITVPGSISNQSFVSAEWFATEQSEVMVIKLRGKVGTAAVSQPVTVKHRPQCETCGRTNKGSNQFCAQCGTALVVA